MYWDVCCREKGFRLRLLSGRLWWTVVVALMMNRCRLSIMFLCYLSTPFFTSVSMCSLSCVPNHMAPSLLGEGDLLCQVARSPITLFHTLCISSFFLFCGGLSFSGRAFSDILALVSWRLITLLWKHARLQIHHTHTHIWTQIIQSYTSPFVHTTPIMCKFIIMFTFLCESYISKSLVKTALPIYLNNPSQMFWKTVVLLCYMRCWRLGIYIYLRVEQRTEEHMGNGWYCRETVGKLMIVFPLCSQEKQYRGWRCLVKLYKVSLNQFKYTTSYICI